MRLLQTLGWLACVVYSTIPWFWLMIHPRAHRWRTHAGSPYRMLVPAWIVMWIGIGAVTGHWRTVALYSTPWNWIPAGILFGTGILLYKLSQTGFSPLQLYGVPEIVAGNHEQRLVTTGIRSRVRHPVYLGHLCEMVAWSIGTGLIVCWLLTAFAIVSGAVMIRMEDAELEKRFGEEYLAYRSRVPAILPRLFA
jgi:protein-S-isoprenylcysteine O-methyltransferase Ste14